MSAQLEDAKQKREAAQTAAQQAGAAARASVRTIPLSGKSIEAALTDHPDRGAGAGATLRSPEAAAATPAPAMPSGRPPLPAPTHVTPMSAAAKALPHTQSANTGSATFVPQAPVGLLAAIAAGKSHLRPVHSSGDLTDQTATPRSRSRTMARSQTPDPSTTTGALVAHLTQRKGALAGCPVASPAPATVLSGLGTHPSYNVNRVPKRLNRSGSSEDRFGPDSDTSPRHAP